MGGTPPGRGGPCLPRARPRPPLERHPGTRAPQRRWRGPRPHRRARRRSERRHMAHQRNS
eukprot:8443201-Alexandrium_andersonii.AAC.1